MGTPDLVELYTAATYWTLKHTPGRGNRRVATDSTNLCTWVRAYALRQGVAESQLDEAERHAQHAIANPDQKPPLAGESFSHFYLAYAAGILAAVDNAPAPSSGAHGAR